MKQSHLFLIIAIAVLSLIAVGVLFTMPESDDKEEEGLRYISAERVADITFLETQFPSLVDGIATIGKTIDTSETEFQQLLDFLNKNTSKFVSYIAYKDKCYRLYAEHKELTVTGPLYNNSKLMTEDKLSLFPLLYEAVNTSNSIFIDDISYSEIRTFFGTNWFFYFNEKHYVITFEIR